MVHVRIKASNGARSGTGTFSDDNSGTGTFSDDKIVAPLLGTPSRIELMMVMFLLPEICSNCGFVCIPTGLQYSFEQGIEIHTSFPINV